MTPSTLTPAIVGDLVAGILIGHRLDHLVEVGAGDAPVLLPSAPGAPVPRRSAVDLRLVPGVPTRLSRWDTAASSWTPAIEDLWADGTPVLLLAVEWLDDLPCVVAERSSGGWFELGPSGRTAQRLNPEDRAWIERWWPTGGQVDVGRTRDDAWRWLAERLPPGSVLATIDYGHVATQRPATSTLAAHRDGRQVSPSPDANLTAHVAIDSLASAGEAAGGHTLAQQRLRDLVPEAFADPAAGPLTELARRSERALWADPRRFGDFWWLAQQMGHAAPSGHPVASGSS